MAKKFTLESAVGYCTTIHLDESMAISRAVVVDRPGNEFLTCATFSRDEHRGIRRSDELNLLDHFPRGGTSTDDVAELRRLAGFFAWVGVHLALRAVS